MYLLSRCVPNDKIGWKALKESVEHFGADSPATVLRPDLSGGIDPDDYFSSIPYGTPYGWVSAQSFLLRLGLFCRKGIQLVVPY